MKPITAAEARALSGPTPQERVDEVFPLIEEKAKNKERRLALCSDFWLNGYDGKDPAYKEACRILSDLGYKVSFYYAEHQFVDMYTVVEW